MVAINATDVRNEWSAVVDSVIREKPRFIKRTRDYMFLSDINVIKDLLSVYTFTAKQFTEDDGSVTLSLDQIDLVENGTDEQDAKIKLAKAIIEYSEDFYSDFNLWASAPNRKPHIPYVIKSLVISDPSAIGGMIQCRHGKN